MIRLLDRRKESEVGGNEIRLQKQYGLDNLVPVYIEAFPRIKNWAGRMHIMFWLRRYARSNPLVVEIAKQGLNDRSRIVRNYSCSALAYSLDSNSIPELSRLLDHYDESTVTDASAAIMAIKKQNHHLWVDRHETGQAFWIVNPEDEPIGNSR